MNGEAPRGTARWRGRLPLDQHPHARPRWGLPENIVRRRWGLRVAAAFGMATLLAAPPYFGADAASAGLRHVSLGHRWRWAPPSPEEVCLALVARQQAAPVAPALLCPPAASRRADMVVRVNAVRLGGELAVLLAAGLAWGWARAPRRAKTMTVVGMSGSLLVLIGVVAAVLASATVWLVFTNPVVVADAANSGSLAPLAGEVVRTLLGALRGLLRYL